MSYYRACPNCGANLDPGEVCDCQNKETAPEAATSEAAKGPRTTTNQNKVRPHCTGAGKGSQV